MKRPLSFRIKGYLWAMTAKNILLGATTGIGTLLLPDYTYLTRGLNAWVVGLVFVGVGIALAAGAITEELRVVRGALLASALAGWLGLTSLFLAIFLHGAHVPLGYLVVFAALILSDLIMRRNPTLSDTPYKDRREK